MRTILLNLVYHGVQAWLLRSHFDDIGHITELAFLSIPTPIVTVTLPIPGFSWWGALYDFLFTYVEIAGASGELLLYGVTLPLSLAGLIQAVRVLGPTVSSIAQAGAQAISGIAGALGGVFGRLRF